MKKIAVGYIRETPRTSMRTGSRSEQEFALKAFCAVNGIELVRIFYDCSEASPFQRKGFSDLLGFVTEYEFPVDYLLLYKYINLTSHAEDFLQCLIDTDEQGLELIPTHKKAFEMRDQSQGKAQWTDYN